MHKIIHVLRIDCVHQWLGLYLNAFVILSMFRMEFFDRFQAFYGVTLRNGDMFSNVKMDQMD